DELWSELPELENEEVLETYQKILEEATQLLLTSEEKTDLLNVQFKVNRVRAGLSREKYQKAHNAKVSQVEIQLKQNHLKIEETLTRIIPIFSVVYFLILVGILFITVKFVP